jgi:hypothetical protein
MEDVLWKVIRKGPEPPLFAQILWATIKSAVDFFGNPIILIYIIGVWLSLARAHGSGP